MTRAKRAVRRCASGARALSRVLASAALLALLVAPAAGAETADAPGEPEALARSFLEHFQQKDFDTLRGLFAPGALVQAARLGNDAEMRVVPFTVDSWTADASNGISAVRNFEMKILDVSSLGFDGGVTVSVRFQATGEVGESIRFVNNGVDSFSFIQHEGEWKIILYNSIEKLVFGG